MTGPIMIVEDSPSIRLLLETSMRYEGHQTVAFSDGIAALQWLASPEGKTPALILLDLMLPRMDGITFLQRLKDKPAFAAVPAIVITTRDTSIDRVKARLAGASEYIVKPFTVQRLAALVRQYLDDPTLILPTVALDQDRQQGHE